MSTPMLASMSSLVVFALPLLVTNILKPLFRRDRLFLLFTCGDSRQKQPNRWNGEERSPKEGGRVRVRAR
jgi:hypothetical protein